MKRACVAIIVAVALVSISACTESENDGDREVKVQRQIPMDPSRLNASLFAAAAKGNAREVNTLLRSGATPDAMNWMHSTALMAAADGGYLDVVRVLLEMGADVNLRNYDGHTALMRAAIAPNNGDIIRELLVHGARVNHQGNDGFTPLMVALVNGNRTIAKVLLQSGANPSAEAIGGQTALTIAAARGDTEALSAILNSRGVVNAENCEGNTALDFAKAGGNKTAVKMLLAEGGKEGSHQPRKTTSLSLLAVTQRNYYGDPNRIGEIKDGVMFFLRESNWTDAETALRVIMKSNSEHQDTLGLLSNYLLLGLILENQKKYHKALDCYVSLLDVARSVSPCLPEWQCQAFMGLGKTYLLMDVFPQAVRQLEIAKFLAKRYGLERNLPTIEGNLRMARGKR